MPYQPKRPCRHPGCPNLADGRYCEEHKKIYERPSAVSRGYDQKWRRESKQFLQEHPLCRTCLEKDHIVEATVVDHVIPHRGDPKLFWDKRNWSPSCKKCHDRKTGTYDSRPTYKYP